MSLDKYISWGRYPKIKPARVDKIFWREELPDLSGYDQKILPYGMGKSYGDSCLNEGAVLLHTRGLNKFIAFDNEIGLLRCEAGVSLAEILDFSVPRGWFLASTPGTKYITVGGAIANDVHGKNHHKSGTFGCHVTQFELVRSSGERMICSPQRNAELFRATIGGLGLTGLITWAEFMLSPCPSAFFAMESIKFDGLDGFYDINDDSEKDYDYTVSWVDTTATGGSLGRGIYNRGNHASPEDYDLPKLKEGGGATFPFDAPFINKASVQAFNIMYYQKQIEEVDKRIEHYNTFFYPLDAVFEWNKAYGKHGFLQYQFVVPFGNDKELVRTLLKRTSASGLSSFLTVLKTFGDIKSPGMLSFPRSGVTMAIDYRFNGDKTLKFLEEMDKLVRDAGGVLYPAKDARMAGADFRHFYPQWEEFAKYIDPAFSSSFWRRVTS